jgi:hypothetical protein
MGAAVPRVSLKLKNVLELYKKPETLQSKNHNSRVIFSEKMVPTVQFREFSHI